MPTPTFPYKSPDWMNSTPVPTKLVIPVRPTNYDSSALGNSNGAKTPSTGQTFPTGR